MILLVLCIFLLGAVVGSLVIVHVDTFLLDYVMHREKKLESYVKGQKTFSPIILEPEETYDEGEKAARLHQMVDTVYEDKG